MADEDFIVPPAWLASTPAPAPAAPPVSEDAPEVITLPPGMADSATHRLPPERQRTPPAKPEVTFFPGAPGAPAPSAPPPPPVVSTPAAPPPPPAPSQSFPPPSASAQGFPPPAAPQRPATPPAAPQRSFPPPAPPVAYSTPSTPPPPPAAPTYAPPAYAPPPAPLTQAPAPPAPAVVPPVAPPTPPPAAAPVAAAAPAARWSLALENGLTVPVTGAVYLGRNPSAGAEHPSAATLTIDDPRKSISKTHALLVVDGGAAWLTDLHSTNGCAVLGDDGSELVLTPGVALAVPAGSTIELGEYAIRLTHS